MSFHTAEEDLRLFSWFAWPEGFVILRVPAHQTDFQSKHAIACYKGTTHTMSMSVSSLIFSAKHAKQS